jgi:hypothetical protein
VNFNNKQTNKQTNKHNKQTKLKYQIHDVSFVQSETKYYKSTMACVWSYRLDSSSTIRISWKFSLSFSSKGLYLLKYNHKQRFSQIQKVNEQNSKLMILTWNISS